MNIINHELRLLESSLERATEHLHKLREELARLKQPQVIIDDRDTIIVVQPCDEYHGDDMNYFVPEHERGSDGS